MESNLYKVRCSCIACNANQKWKEEGKIVSPNQTSLARVQMGISLRLGSLVQVKATLQMNIKRVLFLCYSVQTLDSVTREHPSRSALYKNAQASIHATSCHVTELRLFLFWFTCMCSIGLNDLVYRCSLYSDHWVKTLMDSRLQPCYDMHWNQIHSCTSLIKAPERKTSSQRSLNPDPIIFFFLQTNVVLCNSKRLRLALHSSLLPSDSDGGSGRRSSGESTGLHGRRWLHKCMTALLNEELKISGIAERTSFPASYFHTWLKSDLSNICRQ